MATSWANMATTSANINSGITLATKNGNNICHIPTLVIITITHQCPKIAGHTNTLTPSVLEINKINIFFRPGRSHVRNWQKLVLSLKILVLLKRIFDLQTITCLILLDLSVCFWYDFTHSKLINRLKFRFGLDGVVLDWITYYLANHTQHIVIKQDNFQDSATSSPVTLAQGIPQGLVLGPNLFSWFISPLGDLCKKYEIDCHRYVDDRQLYLSFKPMFPIDQVTCITRLELCIAEIRCWMRTNFLKLNDSQTVFILLGTRYQLQMVNEISINIVDAIIQPTDCVRNLGYMCNAELKKTFHTSIN